MRAFSLLSVIPNDFQLTKIDSLKKEGEIQTFLTFWGKSDSLVFIHLLLTIFISPLPPISKTTLEARNFINVLGQLSYLLLTLSLRQTEEELQNGNGRKENTTELLD